MSRSPCSTLSALLKQQTHHLHLRAESLVPLMGERLTLSSYIDHLRDLWPLVAFTEQSLEWWHHGLGKLWNQGAALLPRAHLVREDLEVLTRSDSMPLHPPPIKAQLPPLENLQQAVGRWYVLGGSRIGGQVIRRELRRVLGHDHGPGFSYYGASSREDGALFREFLAAIDQHDGFWRDRQLIVTAAQQTFTGWCQALGHWTKKI